MRFFEVIILGLIVVPGLAAAGETPIGNDSDMSDRCIKQIQTANGVFIDNSGCGPSGSRTIWEVGSVSGTDGDDRWDLTLFDASVTNPCFNSAVFPIQIWPDPDGGFGMTLTQCRNAQDAPGAFGIGKNGSVITPDHSIGYYVFHRATGDSDWDEIQQVSLKDIVRFSVDFSHGYTINDTPDFKVFVVFSGIDSLGVRRVVEVSLDHVNWHYPDCDDPDDPDYPCDDSDRVHIYEPPGGYVGLFGIVNASHEDFENHDWSCAPETDCTIEISVNNVFNIVASADPHDYYTVPELGWSDFEITSVGVAMECQGRSDHWLNVSDMVLTTKQRPPARLGPPSSVR